LRWDPDGDGVELYRDRSEEQWPRDADGRLSTFTRRPDLEDLLREGAGATQTGVGTSEIGEGPEDLG
jgi:catechol-2,3-dioxygenase